MKKNEILDFRVNWNPKYYCKFCGEVFRIKQTLINHERDCKVIMPNQKNRRRL